MLCNAAIAAMQQVKLECGSDKGVPCCNRHGSAVQQRTGGNGIVTGGW